MATERERAEAGPRDDLDVYRRVLEATDQGFCILEVLFNDRGEAEDYRFLDTNPAFERHTGLHQAVGKTMRELEPHHEEHWFAAYGRVARTGEPERFTQHAEHLDNRWYDVHAFRIGRPEERKVALLFEDITSRKRAEAALRESRERLKKELAGAARLQAISTTLVGEDEPDTLYEQIVEAAVDLAGSDAGSMQVLDSETGELRLLAWKGFHPASAEFWSRVDRGSGSSCGAALGDGARVVVSDVEAADFIGTADLDAFRRSRLRACQTTPLVARSGQLLGMVSTHWREPGEPDPSDLQLLDVLARLAADVLERTLTEQALREADRRKDEFLAVLAHELRNPLAPLANMLQVLERDEVGPDLLERARETMRRQVDQLRRLVDDLLEVSRITRGELRLQRTRVDLAEVVAAAVEDFRPRVEDKGQELVLSLPERPIHLDGDPVRLRQVVENLLGNAWKYTGSEGRLEVVVERADERAVLRVRDTGVGIAPEKLTDIFDMFSRSEAPGEDPGMGGLGVGLALVRELVELHEGSVEARSPGPGRGSEFVVRLPGVREAGATEAADGPPARAGRAESRRILVVDDNRDAAESVAFLLELNGHEVHRAFGGLEAVEVAAELDPDLILLDLGLPDLGGCDVARRIRRQPGGDRPLLVALTGWSQEQDRRRSREAGFDAHLVKPLDLDDLDRLMAGRGAGNGADRPAAEA